jgi:ribosomal protein L3 glutamine methyltransferase
MFRAAKLHLETVRDLLRFAVSRCNEAGVFCGHGYANSTDEAACLIAYGLHLPITELERFLDARVLEQEREQVLGLLQRRISERIPVAYLTSEAWLGEYRFYVDKRVIVPRSFIAELLAEGLNPWITGPESIHSVLDLCTGSGCLAVVAALTYPHAHVTASDFSVAALDVARRNVADYALEERVTLARSDVFDALGDARYDVILSNPPYVTAESMRRLPPEYRHEPQLALAGGGDGLDIVRRIVQSAKAHLNEGGVLVVEIGHNREAVEAEFPTLPLTWLETSAGDGYVFLSPRADLP